MKLAGAAFFFLLVLVHGTGDLDQQLARPLSTFRDDGAGWLGYPLFGALLLVGVFYTRALVRSRREAEAAIAAFAVLLLLAVAATPTLAAFHELCALLLLLLLFAYDALLLYRAESVLLGLHLAAPLALALATHLRSYGMWQKCLIAYFVLIALVHHHLLCHEMGSKLSVATSGPARRSRPLRRRKVYQLEPGREWTRCGMPAR
jgi:hypothetical protein